MTRDRTWFTSPALFLSICPYLARKWACICSYMFVGYMYVVVVTVPPGSLE